MKNCYISIFKTLKPQQLEKAFNICSSRYTYINWLNLHLDILKNIPYLPFIITLLVIPLTFYTIKTIAEKYLTNSIEKLKTFYKVPTLIASCTLIPFVNGVPDLMVAIVSSSDSEGLHIAIGSLLGGFIFAVLLIIGFVVYFSKDGFVRIPFWAFLKELVFYFLGLVLILGFGWKKDLNIFFPIGLICCYLVYMAVTILFFSENDKENDFEKLEIEKDTEKVMDDMEDLENSIVKKKNDQSNFEDIKTLNEKEKEQIEKDISKNLKTRIKFGNSLKTEFWNKKEDNLFFRILNIPIKIPFLLTIPFETNPLFLTNLKYILVFFSFTISIFIFKKKSQIYRILIISSIVTIIFSILSFFNSFKKHHKTIFHFLTLYTSICWMNLITQILLEIIFYYSFLLEINETFLSMIIISSGNSMGDLFSVVALSEIGDSLLAFLAVFSSQSYNFYIGLALNMIFGKQFVFDIFEFEGERRHTGLLIRYLVFFSFFVLLLHFIYGLCCKWVYRKNFLFISIGFYAIFVLAAIVSLKF